MADETTTTGTASETSTALNGSQSPDSQAAPQATDLEKEIQRLRSEQGRQMAELKRQAAFAQQQAQQAELRAQQAAMANMDDFQKAQYRAEMAEREVMTLRQQIESNMLAQQRFERISALSLKTGVPLEHLNQAETPDDLAVLVADWKERQIDEQVKARTDKAAERAKANKVDLGGGKPHEPDSSDEAKFKKAKGNPLELAKLLIR
jgi:hypothetical protein